LETPNRGTSCPSVRFVRQYAMTTRTRPAAAGSAADPCWPGPHLCAAVARCEVAKEPPAQDAEPQVRRQRSRQVKHRRSVGLRRIPSPRSLQAVLTALSTVVAGAFSGAGHDAVICARLGGFQGEINHPWSETIGTMTGIYRVTVPFDAPVLETHEFSVQSSISSTEFGSMLVSSSGSGEYVAQLNISASGLAAAKYLAVLHVERFLKLLAASNDCFIVRPSLLRAQEVSLSTETSDIGSGGTPFGRDTVFAEEQSRVVKIRGSLEVEGAVLDAYDALDGYLQDCLDVNYLLVVADRKPVRWLLAVVGIEALANGSLSPQPRISGNLNKGAKRTFRKGLVELFVSVGVDDAKIQDRGCQRVFDTMLYSTVDHIVYFLAGDVGIEGVTKEEIREWWNIRGSIAHGASVDIDVGALNRLTDVFQAALRRKIGLEPPGPEKQSRGTGNGPSAAPRDSLWQRILSAVGAAQRELFR